MWHNWCMARPRRIDPELVVKARAVVAQATDAKTLRAAQAVLMPALAHTTLEQTAALLGVGRASVPRLQRRFPEGLQLVRSPPRWGGRPVGAVSFVGATRVAESGPGHSASQERSGRPGGVEKKLPETLATLLT